MKKIIILIMTAVMMTAFVGCSNTEKKEYSDNTTPTVETTTQTKTSATQPERETVASTTASEKWYQAEYTSEIKSSDGYTVEGKMKIGSWIKASDSQKVNEIWKQAGGEGEAPDIKDYNYYKDSEAFRSDKAAIAFATVEYTNTTSGYDFSESFPFKLSDKVSLVGKSTVSHNTIVYFSNRPVSDEKYYNITMKKNHWGPVVVGIVATNVFGPNYDANGNEDLDKIEIVFGKSSFKIPISWKESVTKKTLADLEVQTNPLAVDTGAWHSKKGVVINNHWVQDDNGEESYELWRWGNTEQMLGGGVFDKSGNDKMYAKLNKAYNAFEGDIVVSEQGLSETGTTIIKVSGDDKVLYESEAITASSDLIHFRIDVTGVHQLVIESVTDESNTGPSVAIVNNAVCLE